MRLRSIFLLIAVVAAMFVMGWVSYTRTESNVNIHIDTDEVKGDTRSAVGHSKRLVKDAKAALEERSND